MKTCINSEIGELQGVIIHQPGSEVENMTPQNAERALYSDILNLSIAREEYAQFKGVLQKVTQVFEVNELLGTILKNKNIKSEILKQITDNEQIPEITGLYEQDSEKLATQIIEGIVLEKNNLTNYLNEERFLLRPLHNLFFTRDSAMGMNNHVLIGKMANPVRERESIIMKAIFKHHPIFETEILDPANSGNEVQHVKKITLEGGDFQVAGENVFVIGTGVRTSTQGIDFIIENIKTHAAEPFHIIVQELPAAPESFIHLDMVFTFLDLDSCMVYEPVIFEMNRFRTIHIKIENNTVTKIFEEPNILVALRKLGFDLKPIACGGTRDIWIQEREQWHSGANFFAFAPGKIIGYERNVHTIEELNNNGFEVLKASDIISGKTSPENYKKCVVTIAGSELARGGGGARCMTLPFNRKKVNFSG